MKGSILKKRLLLLVAASLFSALYYYVYTTLIGRVRGIGTVDAAAALGLCTFGAIVLLLFSFAFYHLMQSRTPILPELSTEGPMKPEQSGRLLQQICDTAERTDDVADKFRFVDKISEYKTALERWMEERKPYLDKDFKLLDVMQVLPLNRSYISRLFNEGYGASFFDFVMRYRLDESIRMLEERPEMNIRHISDACGFSSPSVFGRAFLKHIGVTPKQYRRTVDPAMAAEHHRRTATI